jgi:nicotinamide-nucleotide amidase
VRVTAKADSVEEADQMIADLEDQIRARAGRFIYGANEDVLEDVLVSWLKEHDSTLAVVQVGMGDVITQAIKQVANSGGVLAKELTLPHPNELRQKLSVQDDVSLKDLALDAAEVILRDAHASAAIAVVSYPDVNEDSDKVEGTAVAVYMPDNVRSRVYGFGGQAEVARDWVRSWSLAAAWRMLKEKYDAE